MKFLRKLSKLYSVEDRQVRYSAPMFKGLQLGGFNFELMTKTGFTCVTSVGSRRHVAPLLHLGSTTTQQTLERDWASQLDDHFSAVGGSDVSPLAALL